MEKDEKKYILYIIQYIKYSVNRCHELFLEKNVFQPEEIGFDML